MKAALSTHRQSDAWSSPWPWQLRAQRALWLATWALLCRWTPKPFNPWRILILKLFGARIRGTPFVHGSARIHFPRHLSLEDRSCIGERAVLYTLAPIEIRAQATVSIEAFLCTGTHDFSREHIPVQTAPIVVGAHAFIAARAFLLPGVEVGEQAVVGACAVVTHNVPQGSIVAGNPARVIGHRTGAT
ncbi:MAG: putative colanic acid biosynthesis acetyltransferase [Opitutaceae bacterium]|nr:putative colanic acid biosynthesis acetyltransferase [Opitutaceae bacterium]